MLLHHARRPARFTAEGALVPLREQDRRRWDTAAIRTGIQVLQAALAQDRLGEFQAQAAIAALHADAPTDRKSTRLNSSHVAISYAVFCLKKKKQNNTTLSELYND